VYTFVFIKQIACFIKAKYKIIVRVGNVTPAHRTQQSDD